jgi:broad specificity phosphatase PhoE
MRRRLSPWIAIPLMTMVAAAVPSTASAQKLIFVVRHAERADAGMTQQADPPLSSAGQARAQKLMTMLGDAGVTAIVTTELIRAQQTAQPLARKLGLSPEVIQHDNAQGVVATLKITHGADVVLVVGHSDTIPAILKAFGKDGVTIPDDEYDDLFVIVPATGMVARLRY